jgi:hypothetical protein
MKYFEIQQIEQQATLVLPKVGLEIETINSRNSIVYSSELCEYHPA